MWLTLRMLLDCLPSAFAEAAATSSQGTPKFAIDPGVGADQMLQMGVGLVLVVLVILALAWVARRLGRGRAATIAGMRVVGGFPIGTRERVVLVDVDDVRLVLGVAPGRVQTLHVLTRPDEGLDARQPEPGFRKALDRALGARLAP